MITEIEAAQAGTITDAVRRVAASEGRDPGELSRSVAEGRVVIMKRGDVSLGIGDGLSTKVNANIGTSPACCNPEDEVEKARIAESLGAHTISDLSMGGDITLMRSRILAATALPLTTVPTYQAVAETGLEHLSDEDLFGNLRRQAEEGISSFVLHLVSGKLLDGVRRSPRIMGVVSKGGSMMAAHMVLRGCENPYLARFDELLDILHRHDIVLSLGNTMRSGCIHDARDRPQVMEMRENVALARRAHEAGVQVILEGVGGHVHPRRIPGYISDYKKKSGFPLFVAGPLPTDIAMGNDHIAGCVGAALASGAGADYLCYITPAEHMGLPTPAQVREGLAAFLIAAHIGDLIKYGRDDRDEALAIRRAALDWKGQAALALDHEKACIANPDGDPCTMCGSFCALRIMQEFCSGPDGRDTVERSR
ncbi:phosphomethylpyrimidine synthase [Methanolinea mesophila]|uniref:phosphomethylpyrimidine synthase ThiC n=1 Tax=Methanolinea mesophila TaxID=547055 RepID=UPI001AE4B496|nr:phosphomethylpyrimidine synthase ThiC [Methanolinea mesophila]MBP1928861.1 phosphomethylpyrimidine synthase [Methanolinea mesophila]